MRALIFVIFESSLHKAGQMSLMSFFTKAFKGAEAETPNHHLRVRQDSFLLDPSKHEFFLKNGWCTFEDVVTNEEINSFMDTFDAISKLEGFVLDDHLLNSGRLFNPEIRKLTQQVINKNAQTILPRMFDMNKVDPHTGGAYQVKPPTPVSDLQIHQDSTVIDEEQDYCLFVWIPFCDVDINNGPIWTLPGSHLWGNSQRSLGVPWNFLKHVGTLREYMSPIPIKKGSVMVFDPALIHCSTPNNSNDIRHAITITVLRKNYELVYFFKNKQISPDLIERYVVDENFYFGYDFISKPDETKWPKTVVEYKPYDFTKEQLVKLIKKHLPANG